jgi:DNA-binding FadR family transcriptional regulator
MRSERPGGTVGFSGMETSTEYRRFAEGRFAEECRRMAPEAKTERHRKILEEMAQAWEKLAKEADLESSHASS